MTNTKEEDYEKLLYDIFEWGTLPQRFSLEEENLKLNYISDVYDSIILKDIVERIGIKDITTFNIILQYILETEGKEFSATNISDYLSSEHREVSTETIYNYLENMCSAFIINKVNRYDVHGKTVLKTLNKYYTSDLGIKKIKAHSQDINYSMCLENMVYNDLISRKYKVYVGKTKKGEVDFVAERYGEIKYIQVCYMLGEDGGETIEREFGAFKDIDDNYEKYVLSLEKGNRSRNGIKHMNIIDFLLQGE